MNDDNCLFCKIAAKKINAAVIFENEHAIGFLDITPRSPGHALVIPKYHAATLLDLPDAEVSHLFFAVKSVDALLAKKLTPDGMTIGINQGRASGQEVDHLHIHLMPRWHSDKGGSIQSVVYNDTESDFGAMMKKIIG